MASLKNEVGKAGDYQDYTTPITLLILIGAIAIRAGKLRQVIMLYRLMGDESALVCFAKLFCAKKNNTAAVE